MSTPIDLGPLVGVLTPIAVSAAGALISVAASWAAYEMRRLTEARLSKDQQDAIATEIETIKSKASTQAGMLIAASATSLAGERITISDPRIAAAAGSIGANVPPVLVSLGWTPERIAKLIAGEIGKLQPPPIDAQTAKTTP